MPLFLNGREIKTWCDNRETHLFNPNLCRNPHNTFFFFVLLTVISVGMKQNASWGYSLPELLIVLLITGILSCTVTAWTGWQQRQQMMMTAQQIQQLLLILRARASWQNSVQLLWLKKGEFWCLGSGPEPPDQCEPGHRYQLIAPYRGVRIVNMTEGMGFYGKRNVARAGHIEFVNAQGRWRVIVSSRARIRLCKSPEQGVCL